MENIYRKVNADLHGHFSTGYFKDDFNTNKIVDIARRRLGRGGILGLCSCRDDRYERFVDLSDRRNCYEKINYGNALYFPEKDIWIIKGQEVNTAEGECLVLGLREREDIPEQMSLDETLLASKIGVDSITILVHPFYRDGTGPHLNDFFNDKYDREQLGRLIDGFEVFTSDSVLWVPLLTPKYANEKAMEYYKMMKRSGLNIGAVMSSDSHSLREIGMSYMTIEMPEQSEIKTYHLLVDFLKKGVKRHNNLEGKMQSSWSGALRHAVAGYGYYGPARISNFLKKKFIIEPAS